MLAPAAKRLLISVVALAAATAPAFANEWEGLSLGVGGGFGVANNELAFGPGPAVDELAGKLDINGLGGKGGFFTLGVGYDHVLLNTLLIGGFVDYDFSDIDTNLSLSVLPLSDLRASASFKIDNQLSVGGRLGYLVSPTTLFFSTFGYAHVETSDLTAKLDGVSGTLASVGSFDGWFAGGGVETLLRNGFSLKAEYRYTSLESENATLLPGSGISDFLSASIKPQIQTGRISLNYRFGDGKTEKVDDSIPPITSSWTGPYIGFGGGYSAASNEATLQDRSTPPGSLFKLDLDGIGSDGGFIFGTLGYDYQLSPKFVVGGFFDADFSNLHHDNTVSLSILDTSLNGGTHTEIDDVLMVGGRFGYLTTPDTLLFASVGYANAGMDPTTAHVSIDDASEGLVLIDGKRFSGVFVGGGIETKIWDSLSLKAEYRYIDLGSESMTLLPNDLPEINEAISTTFDPTIQMGRLSLNYRFGGPAAVASAPLK